MKMKQVLLNYDQATGMIYDGSVFLVTKLGLTPFEPVENKLSIAELIKLKDAGFTADEIVILSKEGVV